MYEPMVPTYIFVLNIYEVQYRKINILKCRYLCAFETYHLFHFMYRKEEKVLSAAAAEHTLFYIVPWGHLLFLLKNSITMIFVSLFRISIQSVFWFIFGLITAATFIQAICCCCLFFVSI